MDRGSLCSGSHVPAEGVVMGKGEEGGGQLNHNACTIRKNPNSEQKETGESHTLMCGV